MTDWTDEVEARLKQQAYECHCTSPDDCCQDCSDIRAALGEIRRLTQENNDWQITAGAEQREKWREQQDTQHWRERAEVAEARVAAFEAGQRPLEGESRSRILRRLGVADLDEALAKIDSLEAKLAEAQAEIDRLREALTFYSDTRRYQGANQPYRDGDDPFTPAGSPFLIDVMRDGGAIARAALRGGEEHSSEAAAIRQLDEPEIAADMPTSGGRSGRRGSKVKADELVRGILTAKCVEDAANDGVALARRVEKMLELQRVDYAANDQAGGYNDALEEALRILNGEEE